MSPNTKTFPEKTGLLGEILLRRSLVTQHQLRLALDAQQQEDRWLGEILVDMGFIEEHDVVAAIVIQCHVPYIAIDKYEISRQAAELVPAAIVRKYQLVPLDRVSDILSVVMLDPLDTVAQAEVRRVTRCRLAPFIATRGEIRCVINRWYDTE